MRALHRGFEHSLVTRPTLLPPTLSSGTQIPSDTVPFNEAPDMKAREICEAGKEALRSGALRFLLLARLPLLFRLSLRGRRGGAALGCAAPAVLLCVHTTCCCC